MQKKISSAALQPIDYGRYDPSRTLPDGQICLFPNSAAKTNGEVFDMVFCRHIPEKVRQEIDDVYKKDGQEIPVQTRIVIEYSRLRVDQNLQDNLNGFDWEVMDAISTLYTKPNEIIYLESIYRVIVGKKTMYPVTDKQCHMVNESIEKMRNMTIKIEIADLFEKDSPIGAALQKKGIRVASNTNYLIPCQILEYQDRPNGYVYGIRLLDDPPLFAYAKSLGLASIYPLAIIDSPLAKTRNTIILQSYLLRIIDKMYRDRAYKNEFSTLIEARDIYSIAGSVQDSDTEKARNRKKTEQILTFWTKKGYIAGYDVIQATKRKIQSYQIQLCEEDRYWDYPESASTHLPLQAKGTQDKQSRSRLKCKR